MYTLNPTLFQHDNNLYCLLREETNVSSWNNSTMTYSLCTLDNDFNILTKKKCKFKINNNIYTDIKRDFLETDKYCIEDVKIYKSKINNEIIGTANILINNKPRMFRCGIVKLDLDNYVIEVIKILEIENMNSDEKNWSIFNHNNDYYVIYSLFPNLKIYNLDISTYNLKLYKSKNIFEKIEGSKIVDNLNNYYTKIYLTCSAIIPKDESKFIIVCKSRKQDNKYHYYKIEFDFEKFDISIDFECLFSGVKCYLNDVKLINNNYIECWGINDRAYDFVNRIL